MLNATHLRYLEDRGVSEAVAQANGVRSISSATELTGLTPLPFASSQAAHVPGLLFPLVTPTGEVNGHQFRADTPRSINGRTVKFDSPRGQANHLYVPRSSLSALSDASVPLLITEGMMKALSIATLLELPAVALTGVYNFVGAQSKNFTSMLPDWREGVNLFKRDVWVCFDSDVATNSNVHAAAKALGAWLSMNKHASVQYLLLPSSDAGEKQGIDDYLAALKTSKGAAQAKIALHLSSRLCRKPASHRASTMIEVAVDAELPKTHLDAAEAWWAAQGSDEVRRVQGEGTWVRFDGRRWLADGVRRTALEHSVSSYLTGLYADAKNQARQAEKGDEQTAFYDLANNYSLGSYHREVLGMCERMSSMMVAQEFFDPPESKYLLNVANGTIDLNTLHLRPHSAADRLTGTSRVEYDVDAVSPEWDAFLAKIVPAVEVREYLQRVMGMSLVADPGTQGAWVISGEGGNGKGVFTRIVSAVLGHDYATVIPRTVLQAGKRDEHPTQLMELRGRRFALLDEFPAGGTFNVELFKEITGGGEIKARSMRQDFTQFRPTHTLFITTNHLPEVDGTDQAMWRRLRHLVFPYSVPADEVDDTMESRILEREAPGILNWMLRGYVSYRDGGLREPDAVLEATQEWRYSQDHMLMFASEVLVSSTGSGVPINDVHAAYTRWCDKHDITFTSRASAMNIFSELQRRGFDVRKDHRFGGREGKKGNWLIGYELSNVSRLDDRRVEGVF